MRIDGVHHRTISPGDDGRSIRLIDQTKLPHELVFLRVQGLEEAARAISEMQVRGAPLIGVTAAYGLWLALLRDPGDASLLSAVETLSATRPTAVNLRWALVRMRDLLLPLPEEQRAQAARAEADRICEEDVEINRAIGEHGLPLLKEIHEKKRPGEPVNVLTHCNAGWLATVDWGTALSPIYRAHDAGVPVHVWVDETRPRLQGALTAWELRSHGVPHTVVVDNAGGHLMQRGMVDICIVGTDRTTADGDVCNKIGTYLKALAARESGVPFYAALPSPTIDWSVGDGLREIPIESRSETEVTQVLGPLPDGTAGCVSLFPAGTRAENPAFDVTPAALVTGLITDKGLCRASREGLLSLFPSGRDEARSGP
ncbi:MAG: S-methyl-5-thioribose-1-phosphate isomerase [Myxococcota bacterium]